jgi:glycosyltransferase involved in cell wall biosynthesis
MAGKILIISEFGCGPPYYGNRTRMRTLIAELRALGYSIDFAGVRFSAEEKAATLPHIDCWVHSFDEPAVAFFWRRQKWAMKQWLRRMQSRDVAETSDIANLDRWFNPGWLDEARKLQAREDYRNVVVAYVFHSIFLEAFPDPCRRILEAQDTFAARHEKVEAAGIGRYWFSCSEGEERMGLERAHVVLAIQDEEAAVFRRQLRGKTDVRVVGHFVEPCEVAESPGAAQRIGYIGAYNPLNFQGLQWFIRQVWPAVWREFPAARLVVAGSICDKLKPDPRLEFLGKVRDAAQAHAEFLVSINPMPSGTGLKIKTVEAMACGRPVVATPAGCAGLRAYLGQGLIEAKDAESFAAALISWLRDPDEARHQGTLAREAVTAFNLRSTTELKAAFQ